MYLSLVIFILLFGYLFKASAVSGMDNHSKPSKNISFPNDQINYQSLSQPMQNQITVRQAKQLPVVPIQKQNPLNPPFSFQAPLYGAKFHQNLQKPYPTLYPEKKERKPWSLMQKIFKATSKSPSNNAIIPERYTLDMKSQSNSDLKFPIPPPRVRLYESYNSISPEDSKEQRQSLIVNSLEKLLKSLGLSQYYPTFEKHEIDIEVFHTLTPEDLTELGIKTMGARRKMLLYLERNGTPFRNSLDSSSEIFPM